MIKKTPLEEYENVRKNGLLAIALREDDELIEVKFTNGTETVNNGDSRVGFTGEEDIGNGNKVVLTP